LKNIGFYLSRIFLLQPVEFLQQKPIFLITKNENNQVFFEELINAKKIFQKFWIKALVLD